MASSHAFNSLGQVFAAGGDTPLILQASTGLGGTALLAAVVAKFPKLSSSEQQTLASHVEQAALVASTIDEESISGDTPIVQLLDSVPQDFSLFGGEDMGRRIRVTAEITSGESSRPILAKLDFENMPDMDRLFESVREFIDRMVDEYPEAAERMGLERVEEIGIEIVGIQRSY